MTGRVLCLEAPGGAAGDMLLAALLDVGAPLQAVETALESLKIPGWRLHLQRTTRCGVQAQRASFRPVAQPEDQQGDPGSAPPPREPAHPGNGHDHSQPHEPVHRHTHEHEHGHGHEHGHEHGHGHGHGHPHGLAPDTTMEPDFPDQPERTWRSIRALLEAAPLPDPIRSSAIRVFQKLAEAEARVHGGAPDDVHFHEVGSVDAILDIVGSVAALHALQVDSIFCGPLPIGRGWVRCAHGLMPIPAPATLYLMEGWPTARGVDGMEQVTPTGAALWTTIGSPEAPPPFRVHAVGYGAGKKSIDDRPNVVRAVLGIQEQRGSLVTTTLAQVDDMAGEHLPPLIDQLLANGALDVTVTPTVMKKGRPGYRVEAISHPQCSAGVARTLLAHSSTFGVRQWEARRRVLDRWHVHTQTSFGAVRIKVGALDGELLQAAPEFADVLACAHAHQVPTARVHAEAIHAWHSLPPASRWKP